MFFFICFCIFFRGGVGGGGEFREKIFWGGWVGVNRLNRQDWIICRFKRGLDKKEKRKGLCL